MATTGLVKQVIRDGTGKPVAVLLPIDEYYRLVEHRATEPTGAAAQHPLYGAFSHLGAISATTQEMDEALTELWSVWDRNGEP